MNNRGLYIVLFSFVILGLFLSYSNHWDNGFNFDDSHTILNNRAIKENQSWLAFFKDPLTYSSLPQNTSYRPLTTMSAAVDYNLAGNKTDVWYFHLTNFSGHLVLTILLVLLFRTWVPESMSRYASLIAILAAGLFGLHTYHPETITYISSRSDSLSTLWVVVTLLFYIYFPKLRKYQLYMIPFVIAFLFKQTAIVIPLLLFFYLLYVESENFGKKISTRFIKALITLSPAFILAVVLYLFNSKMTPDTFSVGFIDTFDYLISQPFVMARYITTFFFPFDLSADTDWKVINSMADPRFITGMAFMIVVALLFLRTAIAKRTSPISLAIAWYIICLLPTSSVFPLSEVMNDHRVYFSNIGLSFLVVYSVFLIARWLTEKFALKKEVAQWSSIGLVSLLIIANAYGTYQRNEVWESPETLWKDVTLKSPRNARGLMNYGLQLVAANKPEEGLSYYQEAQKLDPDYIYLQINLGVVKEYLTYPTREIEEHFLKAVRYTFPGNAAPHYYYANWLFGRNRVDESFEILKQAKAITKNDELVNELYIQVEAAMKREKVGPL